MANKAHDHSHRETVTLVRWSRKPGDNPIIRLVTFSVLGLILCLILMIFMPGMRSFGTSALFTAAFATILTIPTITARIALTRGVAKRINDTLAEMTGRSSDSISTSQLRRLIKSGEQFPLQVIGMPGLCLQVKRVPTLKKDATEKLLAVLTVAPPRIGIASFDRLLTSALNSGPEHPSPAG